MLEIFMFKAGIGSMNELIGFGIGILGIILAIVFYLNSIIKTEPAYQISAIEIINKSKNIDLHGINISYDGQEIDRLMKSTVYFWNNGKKTLRSSDIVSSNRININVIDGEILSANIVKTSRIPIRFRIDKSIDIRKVNIEFDFLDYRDGAAIEILHTSNVKYPFVDGVVMGAPKGLKNFGIVPSGRGNKQLILYLSKKIKFSIPQKAFFRLYMIFVIFLVLIFFSYGILLKIDPAFSIGPQPGGTFYLINGIIYSLLLSTLLIPRNKYPRSLVIEEN